MTPRLAAAAAVCVPGAIVVVLVGTALGWWSDGGTATPARPLDVRTSLVPAQSFFGDPLLAEVDVDLDTRAISPAQVRVLPNFTPYAQTGAPTVSTSRSGRAATMRFRYRIQCVSDGCLPGEKPRPLRLSPVTVSVRERGHTRSVTATWPPARVASRLSGGDLQRARFHRPTALLRPAYTTSPTTLADLLTVIVGALALLAAALFSLEAIRLFRHRRTRLALTPLARALRLTRESARRSNDADRRKALSLLSRTLDDEGAASLADAASVAAWSGSPPSPETALQLADDVETSRSNPR